ncbi:MAG: hypothetical protein V3V20_03840 [Algisphaera sp.]
MNVIATPFRRLVTSLCLLALIASLGACRGASGPFPLLVYSDDGDLLPKPSSAGLVVDPNSPIEDVPMPIGFKGVPSKSMSRTDGNHRVVLHVYQGRANLLDTAAFYRRNLDDFGWKVDGFDTGDPNATVQTYAKGNEVLRINILGDKGKVTLNISIDGNPTPTTR